jgi:iron complex outermembrane receptor protein
MRKSVSVFGLLPALWLAAPAMGQDPATDPAASDEGEEQGAIIVTAQRREQAAIDVAATISVLGNEEIVERGLYEVQDIGRLVPNVTIEGQYGNASNPLITIRGVGLEDFNDNNSSPAGVYVDDVYLVAPPMLAFGLFDLERVEVLKGPQGTLYGRNTTAGAVNFVTARPTTDFEGFVRTNLEEYDRFTAEGAISGPISETLAFRIAGLADTGGGYIRNRTLDRTEGDRDFLAGRALLQWEPSADVEVLLNVHAARDRSDLGQYQHVGLLADPVSFTPCAAAIAGRTDPATCVDPFGYSDTDGDVDAGDYNKRGRVDYDSFGTSATIKANLSKAVSLTSVTAFEGFDGTRFEDSDGSPNRLIEIDYGVDVEQFSQEIRLNGEAPRLDWIVGGYFGTDTIRVSNDYDVFADFRPLTGGPDFATVFFARNAYVQKTDVYAVFGHGFYEVADRLTAELGLRYANERRTFRTVSSFIESEADLASIGLGPDGTFLDESRAIEDDNLLWSVGLSYDTGWGIVYGKVSNGFKSGGFNGGIPFSPEEVVPFGEETLIAYELGIKGTFPAIDLQFEVAGFYYDYSDLQVFTLADTGTSAVPVQILTNAADSEIYGLDGNVLWSPAAGLDFNLGVGLLSAKYLEADIGGRDLSGASLTNAPEVSIVGGASYEHHLGSWRAVLDLDARYQSREVLENIAVLPDVDTTVRQAGFALVDARLAIGTSDGQFEFALYAKNLFDARPVVNILTVVDFGFSEYTYMQPRRFGLSVLKRF